MSCNKPIHPVSARAGVLRIAPRQAEEPPGFPRTLASRPTHFDCHPRHPDSNHRRVDPPRRLAPAALARLLGRTVSLKSAGSPRQLKFCFSAPGLSCRFFVHPPQSPWTCDMTQLDVRVEIRSPSNPIASRAARNFQLLHLKGFEVSRIRDCAFFDCVSLDSIWRPCLQLSGSSINLHSFSVRILDCFCLLVCVDSDGHIRSDVKYSNGWPERASLRGTNRANCPTRSGMLRSMAKQRHGHT
jgi:hypothetical protein